MPTIRRCCILGCMSNSRQNPHLQFFQFPKPDNPFHKLWTQACHASLSRILPFKKPVVCALHFHPHCIGGRRLTGTAVPCLKLEVPSNLKAVEQQAMVDEIERSRKYAYINAVVYEWLVRANLNSQLRGSITHGMIKEKAETAKHMINCDSFTADNRWLYRFRETHLGGFAQKLSANKLKPLGPSLWIPDIIQDLKHLFPPTTSERLDTVENIPYNDYVKESDQYDEDDDGEIEQNYKEEKSDEQQHNVNNYYNNQNGYKSCNNQMTVDNGYNAYQDYYNQQQQQPHINLQQSKKQSTLRKSNNNGNKVQYRNAKQQQIKQQKLQQDKNHSLASNYCKEKRKATTISSATTLSNNDNGRNINNNNNNNINDSNSNHSDGEIRLKRRWSDDSENDEQEHGPRISKVTTLQSHNDFIADLTIDIDNDNDNNFEMNNDCNSVSHNDNLKYKIKLPKLTESHNATTKNSHKFTNGTSGLSSSEYVKIPVKQITGHNLQSHSVRSSTTRIRELENYTQALEYLKPLEDFALYKENFRAIGLISQLEMVLRKSIGNPTSRLTM